MELFASDIEDFYTKLINLVNLLLNIFINESIGNDR
jgi:hypothetical protein